MFKKLLIMAILGIAIVVGIIFPVMAANNDVAGVTDTITGDASGDEAPSVEEEAVDEGTAEAVDEGTAEAPTSPPPGKQSANGATVTLTLTNEELTAIIDARIEALESPVTDSLSEALQDLGDEVAPISAEFLNSNHSQRIIDL